MHSTSSFLESDPVSKNRMIALLGLKRIIDKRIQKVAIVKRIMQFPSLEW